jgi:vesicle-fusing ATPase
MLSSEDTAGMTELQKMEYISRGFEDAHKSMEAIVILDDLEELIEYVEVGQTCSYNARVLHMLRSLVKKECSNKFLVIGTASRVDTLRDFDLWSRFTFREEVATLTEADHQTLIMEVPELRNPRFREGMTMRELFSTTGHSTE